VDYNFIDGSAPRDTQRKAKIIKRYGNRKLYDTEQSSYIVLDDIAKMIRNKEEVKVIDNETKSDITSATLTQIIFGAERKSLVSTPLELLKSIIKKGDGSFSNFLAGLGLFKSEVENKASTAEEGRGDRENSGDRGVTPGYENGERVKNRQYKTIPERVAQAALTQGVIDNENLVLPTSNNNSTSEE